MKAKNLLKMAVAAFLISGMGASNAMAATNSGNATATVIAPVSFGAGATDLNFGSFDGTVAGTVTISNTGNTSGGSIAQNPLATAQSGSTVINGDGALAVTVSVLTDGPLSNGVPANDMVAAYTIEGGAPASVTTNLVAGTLTLGIGGTLNVAAAQPAGSYLGTYTVTANY